MSQPRASSASPTTVIVAASAPSNGYDDTNHPSARSHSFRLAPRSVSDDRAPPATSTAAAAASDSPAANSSLQFGGLPPPSHRSIRTSACPPATPRPSYSAG